MKNGQIAHLDRNPVHNSVENLAWLCLEDHDLYDTSIYEDGGARLGFGGQESRLKYYVADIKAAVFDELRRPSKMKLPTVGRFETSEIRLLATKSGI